jgi:hypothetical protein
MSDVALLSSKFVTTTLYSTTYVSTSTQVVRDRFDTSNQLHCPQGEEMNSNKDVNVNCNRINELQINDDSGRILRTPKRDFTGTSPDTITPATSTCTTTTVATSTCNTASFESSDNDDPEHLPRTVPDREVSLQDLIAGREIHNLPRYAVELGSYAGNHLKPIGVTKLFREEIRGDRRYPDDVDLNNNVYGQLIRRLAIHADAPKEIDDLFFVRRIKVNMKMSEEDPTLPIYQFDGKYFERILNNRDAVVKKYISERRYSAPGTPLPAVKVPRPPLYRQTPLTSGPRLHVGTPTIPRQLSYTMEIPTDSSTHSNLGSPSWSYSTTAAESRLYTGLLPPTVPPLYTMNPQLISGQPLYVESPSPSQTALDQFPPPSPPTGLPRQNPSSRESRTASHTFTPQALGPSMHTELPPPLHPYLADFRLSARYNFEAFCLEHGMQDFRQTHATLMPS